MNKAAIDLFSDTITRPSQAMRKAMACAKVGDEQLREDPTINRLEEMVCELLGKPAAVFLPSGTMCNQIAIRLHTSPGDEIIMDHTAHVRMFETGGAAAHSGACIYCLQGDRGIFSPDQIKEAIREENNHFPRSRMIVIEQTTNIGGGAIWPLEQIRKIAAIARQHNLALHMDGARLLNAVVESGVSAKEYANTVDSLWIDFSKGLGAPVGAMLAGSHDFIQRAWRLKHQFGGAMRQSGILAAGAIYALENHVERLAEDHQNARLLAQGILDIQGIDVDQVETNLVFFDVKGLGANAQEFHQALLERSLRVSFSEKTRLRAVTHLDVNRKDIHQAIGIIQQTATEFDPQGLTRHWQRSQ
jgi:threonine aldolase